LRIVYVGRLHHGHKGVLDMVPLVEHLQRRQFPFRLTIVGSGEDEAELRQRLQVWTEQGQVVFTGFQTPRQLYEHVYPNQDVVMLFSPSEGCPLAVEEAMANGVVPVCCEFLGVHSLGFLQPGRTGYIFPRGDFEQATTQLQTLFEDRAHLAGLSAACREAAPAFYLEKVSGQWCDALADVCRRPPRPLERSPAELGLDLPPGGSRLERFLSPAWADTLRRWARRWPVHPDGWAEWPSCLSSFPQEAHTALLDQLRVLDQAARKQEHPNAIR
jgi:hypothetical protein